MTRSIWNVLVFFIPVVLVIGLLRYAINDNSVVFFPTVMDVVDSFSNFPSIQELLAPVLSDVASGSKVLEDFSSISNTGDFFNVVGNFFRFIGSVVAVPFRVLFIPFQYVGWFFEWLFTWAGNA